MGHCFRGEGIAGATYISFQCTGSMLVRKHKRQEALLERGVERLTSKENYSAGFGTLHAGHCCAGVERVVGEGDVDVGVGEGLFAFESSICVCHLSLVRTWLFLTKSRLKDQEGLDGDHGGASYIGWLTLNVSSGKAGPKNR